MADEVWEELLTGKIQGMDSGTAYLAQTKSMIIYPIKIVHNDSYESGSGQFVGKNRNRTMLN